MSNPVASPTTPDTDVILVQMLTYLRRRDPITLYRPCAYVNDQPSRLMTYKVVILKELANQGYVRLYFIDGFVLGAELTHAGIRRAEVLMR